MFVDDVNHFFSLCEYRNGTEINQLLETILELRERLGGKDNDSLAPLLLNKALNAIALV